MNINCLGLNLRQILSKHYPIFFGGKVGEAGPKNDCIIFKTSSAFMQRFVLKLFSNVVVIPRLEHLKGISRPGKS